MIITPSELETPIHGQDDAGSSSSKSRSRSGSPSPKNKERATAPTALVQPGAAGPSNYYRQHTATSSTYLSPPLSGRTSCHYSASHTTAATRHDARPPIFTGHWSTYFSDQASPSYLASLGDRWSCSSDGPCRISPYSGASYGLLPAVTILSSKSWNVTPYSASTSPAASSNAECVLRRTGSSHR